MRLQIAICTLLTVLAAGLAGCAPTKPTRFYVLDSAAEQPIAKSASNMAIGVGPITLPQYLDRPQIVTRVSGNQLELAEFDQWGGDIQDNITRTLATNLSSLLGTDRVSLFPSKNDAPIDYQIQVDVTAFEQAPNGESVLGAFWSVITPADGKVVLMRRSTFRTAAPAATGNGYDAAVAAMSQNLQSLSQDIAKAVSDLAQQ